ncbi:hypothetical protein F4809DRAFT_630663 [Biscogniauxia mediterranea]|nr:hypothetical protein F4809DRAFT_630663 [Biscogniauxia mediterranea]
MNHEARGQIINLQPLSTDPSLTGKYRRNGKLQSCEPCRKSKLKCDHVVPTCRRCIRRRCADRCVYHPSPLSKGNRLRNEVSLTPLTLGNDERIPDAIPSVELPESHNGVTADTPLPRTFESRARLHRAASAPPLHTHHHGSVRVNSSFLGATNFTSFLSENLRYLGGVSIELEATQLREVTISHDRIARGCRVLSFLKDRPMINQFVARYYEICEGGGTICPESIMKEWLFKFWLHHKEHLRDQDPEKMSRLSELIWHNTQTPVSFDENTSPMQWARAATGHVIRWEVIGLIASTVGQCVGTLEASDQFLKEHKVERSTLARQMHEVSTACLAFCRECEVLDDLYLWLLTENVALTDTIKGQGSYAMYRESGELVNAVVAVGLHQDIRSGKPRMPMFIEETRKRILVQTYSADISISSFLGRPPRLSYRYCNLVPPLDISEKQLLLNKHEIVSSLDANGFNTSGNITRATWMRAWLGFAPRREDVLDLSLGQYTREEIIHRAELIQKRSEEYWASLPPFLRKIRDGNTDEGTPLQTLFQSIILQGFRANELLLQRVLIRKAGASSDKLICTASLIFQDILQLSRRHEVSSIFQNDISALLAIQGLRSAAVIAVELLKQEQQPNYPKHPLLPRSRTIQDLAVFAARLGDVDPADGSFTTCEHGRKVIQKILDLILSPPNHADRAQVPQSPRANPVQEQGLESASAQIFTYPATQENTWDIHETANFSMGDLNLELEGPFLGNDNDFVQWLESVDWEKSI